VSDSGTSQVSEFENRQQIQIATRGRALTRRFENPACKRIRERSDILSTKKTTPGQRGELGRGNLGTIGKGGDRDRSLFYRSDQRRKGGEKRC
jgi:hypothetical protein